MATQDLQAAVEAYIAAKWGKGPIPARLDRVLARAAGISFPQMRAGWPADTGVEDLPDV